jgi:hypothetical protein
VRRLSRTLALSLSLAGDEGSRHGSVVACQLEHAPRAAEVLLSVMQMQRTQRGLRRSWSAPSCSSSRALYVPGAPSAPRTGRRRARACVLMAGAEQERACAAGPCFPGDAGACRRAPLLPCSVVLSPSLRCGARAHGRCFPRSWDPPTRACRYSLRKRCTRRYPRAVAGCLAPRACDSA